MSAVADRVRELMLEEEKLAQEKAVNTQPTFPNVDHITPEGIESLSQAIQTVITTYTLQLAQEADTKGYEAGMCSGQVHAARTIRDALDKVIVRAEE